jgi:hypothetical protein
VHEQLRIDAIAGEQLKRATELRAETRRCHFPFDLFVARGYATHILENAPPAKRGKSACMGSSEGTFQTYLSRLLVIAA